MLCFRYSQLYVSHMCKRILKFELQLTLWKFVAENHTENFATLKITLKNIIKEGFTENYTEKRPLLFRNAKTVNLSQFLSKLNTIFNLLIQ